jgi:hypothetical protein
MDTRVGFFELISTYFVRIFYTHIYDETIKKVKSSNNIGSNLIEEYRAGIRAFKTAISTNERYYSETVKDLWQTFHLISPITLPELIDNIVKFFIPESFHRQLINESLRDKWMAKIMINMVGEFSVRINTMYVEKIINEKDRTPNLIHQLQDDFNQILETMRFEQHQKLTNQAVQPISAVPKATYDKMKELVLLAKSAKESAEREVERLRAELFAAEREIRLLKSIDLRNEEIKDFNNIKNKEKPHINDSINDFRNDFRNDSKNDSRNDSKNELKNDSKKDSRNDSKNDSKKDSRNDSRNDSKNESKNELKNDLKKESKNESKKESKKESNKESNNEKNESKNESKKESNNEKKESNEKNEKNESKNSLASLIDKNDSDDSDDSDVTADKILARRKNKKQ